MEDAPFPVGLYPDPDRFHIPMTSAAPVSRTKVDVFRMEAVWTMVAIMRSRVGGYDGAAAGLAHEMVVRFPDADDVSGHRGIPQRVTEWKLRMPCSGELYDDACAATSVTKWTARGKPCRRSYGSQVRGSRTGASPLQLRSYRPPVPSKDSELLRTPRGFVNDPVSVPEAVPRYRFRTT